MTITHLGGLTQYEYYKPSKQLLETFEKPHGSGSLSIHIEAPEFTSLCPITRQPDFATIVIDYVPDERCIESKSLKLYLGSFRMHGDFHEACVTTIGNDLIELLHPSSLIVEGRFTPRGGIPFWPKLTYLRNG
jgi:7-cyano-7-deazaguanine reductase